MGSVIDHGRDAPRRLEILFLARQFFVNLLVAVAITILATAIIFHGRSSVPLWGIGNLAFDLIPSTMFPCLGASLAITKATASAIRRGLISPSHARIYALLPRQDALAGVVIGLGLLAVLGAGFIGAVIYAYGQQPVPYAAIVMGKLIYALILCMANTPVIIARAKEGPWRCAAKEEARRG